MLSKKTINILILVSMIVSVAVSVTFNFAHAGITEAVEQYAAPGGAAIKEEIDKISTDIVEFARSIFLILAVVFVIWAGFIWWGAGGDPQRIMSAKKMMAGFVVCMICVFYAEKIVGGLAGLFGGYEPS